MVNSLVTAPIFIVTSIYQPSLQLDKFWTKMGSSVTVIALMMFGLMIGNTFAETVPLECQQLEVVEYCSDLINTNMANLPGFVRLAFHDCVGEGGCNGCVDLEKGDNNGLKVYMDALEAKYDDNNVREVMSRADFWILCSHVAIRSGQRISLRSSDASSLRLQMKYGRVDCDNDDPDQRAAGDTYPSPHGNYSRTTGYFAEEFGLTSNETIALLGAHTLGRARPSDSGFSNKWVRDEFAFDNIYYKDILNKNLNWTQVDLDGDDAVSHKQWSQRQGDGNFKHLMFSADMCLAVDVDPSENGTVTEEFDTIGNSPGYDLVAEYADNNAKWLQDFSTAYAKMVEKTADGSGIILKEAQPDGGSSVCKGEYNEGTTTESSVGVISPSLQLLSTLLLISIYSIYSARS